MASDLYSHPITQLPMLVLVGNLPASERCYGRPCV